MSESETKVVHCQKTSYDIYIGRRANKFHHFGNPFSHRDNTLAAVEVTTREKAIQDFRDWLSGEKWTEIEPERRAWILSNIKSLKGKRLGCWCSPLNCHGDVLKELADAQ